MKKTFCELITKRIHLPILAFTAMIMNSEMPPGDTFDSAVMPALGFGFVIILGIIFLIIAGLSIFFLVFWILMLVDCIRREFPDRDIWLAILIISFFLGLYWLAVIVYYFTVKKKYGEIKKTPSSPTPPTSPSSSIPPQKL